MPTAIAATTPPTWPARTDGATLDDNGPQPPDMEFRELWEDKQRGLTFADLIDIVNPLQHIPIVSTIYRGITGDEIGFGSRLVGGALFGGAIGFGAALFQSVVEEASGKDIGANMLALVDDLAGGGEAKRKEPGPGAVADAADPAAAAAAASAPAAGPGPAPEVAPFSLPATAAPAVLPAKARSPLPSADRHAAAGNAFPAHPDRSVTRGQNDRILAAVEAARRTQANLLFAGAAAEPPAARSDSRTAAQKETKEDTAEEAQPAAPAPRSAPAHPNAIPAGASPEWISAAMKRALNKYEETLRLRQAQATR